MNRGDTVPQLIEKCEVDELTRWHGHKHTMLQSNNTQTRPVDSLASTMVSLCSGAVSLRSVCIRVCFLGHARPCYGDDAAPGAPRPVPV